MNHTPDCLVICGPTASGKTALAVALAQILNGEVVSADSMQVYRGMDIGTAKPTAEEMQGVPHHMLDVADPWENFSVGRYVAQAIPIMDDILARGKLPIVAGGTGLYIDNLMAGREFAPFAPDTAGVRQQLQQQAREEGLEPLRDKLAQVDPESAQRLHPNDEKRIIRALEVYLTTGKTISQHNRESQAIPPRYHPLTIGLDFEQRPHLWQRIDRRVDVMMEQGLLEEAEGFLKSYPGGTAVQAIGYKELAPYFRKECPLETAVENIRRETRRYAKRQLTWFRREEEAHWLYVDEPGGLTRLVEQAKEIAVQTHILEGRNSHGT